MTRTRPTVAGEARPEAGMSYLRFCVKMSIFSRGVGE